MKVKREVKLALTAIAAVVILIWGINFLKAKALFDRNNVFYGIYDRVDGLKVSSSVIYRGYSVGQVSAIQFTGERYDKVLVQFTVGKKLQISSCSSSTLRETGCRFTQIRSSSGKLQRNCLEKKKHLNR